MKYYVVSDVHGFYTEMVKALEEKGFFEDKEEHKLIICGDLLDRGAENKEVINFVLQMMKEDRIILIRGNHEDLFELLVDELMYGETYDLEKKDSYHIHNGTWQTALDLSGFSHNNAIARPLMVANILKNTPFYKKILPSMLNYYETEHYIFTHGYIPCKATQGKAYYSPHKSYYFNVDWRNASYEEWKMARWYNGMEFACKRKLGVKDKTVVCGHWNASYGHAEIEHKCSEFGKDADLTPFFHNSVIGIDACTKWSGFVNCIVIED